MQHSKRSGAALITYWPEFVSIVLAFAFFFLRLAISPVFQEPLTVAWLTVQTSLLGIAWRKAAKDQLSELKGALDHHNEIPTLLESIADPRCRQHAALRYGQLVHNLKLLKDGVISLEPDESLDYQVALVGGAKCSLRATHVVLEEADLQQWLKFNNFTKLATAMKDSKVGIKERLFLIADDLILEDLSDALEKVLDVNKDLGFATKARLVPRASIDGTDEGGKRDVPSFIYVDNETLVVAAIALASPRKWNMKAYTKSALEKEPIKTDLAYWMRLFEYVGCKNLSDIIPSTR